MKKAFTLVELVGVVIILSLLALLTFTFITKVVNSKKTEISDAMNKIISDAASLYISYDYHKFPKIDGNIYCILLSELTDEEILTEPIKDPITSETIPLTNYVKVEVNVDEYKYSVVEACTERK